MRALRPCFLLLMLALLTGCGKSMETARQLAETNVYKEATYENAAKAGPTVVVLPGTISSPSYEFLARVKPDNILEYGELELGKANFKVIERNSVNAFYQEIALAANMGDGSMGLQFAKHDVAPPQWVVLFDIADVKTQTTAFSYADRNSKMFAGALMGSFLGSVELGEGVIGSINNAKEQRSWNITMRYRVLDGVTGQKLHEGNFTEQATINKELVGFLGVDSAQAGGRTLATVTQRLVQKAVLDMDKQHKLPAMAQAQAQAEAAAELQAQAKKAASKGGKGAKGGKGGKGDKAGDSQYAALHLQPQAAPDAPDVPCTPKKLGGFTCQMPDAWTTDAPPRALEVALALKPQLKKMMESSNRNGKSDLMDAIVAYEVVRLAGPLVTLTDPDSPLSKLGKFVALSGQGLEGRLLLFPGASGKVTPEKLTNAVLGHLQNAVVVEPLGMETVPGGSDQRNIRVFKYIKVERRTEVSDKPDIGIDEKKEEKVVSIPHYFNMALAVVPKGDDLLMVIVVAPEERFLPQLEAVKKLVASAQ